MKKIIHQNAEAGITQVWHSDSEGNVTLETKQAVRDIVEDNKAQFNRVDERARWGEGQKVASIPLSILHELRQKGILNDQKAFRAWLNDPDNRAFRTRPGQV